MDTTNPGAGGASRTGNARGEQWARPTLSRLSAPDESVPLSPTPDEKGPLLAAFYLALANLAASLRKWLLPHFAIGFSLFILTAYLTSFLLFGSWASGWKWVLMGIVVLGYALIAFGYSFFTTCLLAVRLACVHWGEFIDAVLDHIQNYAAEKAAQLPTGLTKPQAKTILRAGIRDTFSQFHPSQTGLPRALGFVAAVTTAMAVKAVLFSKISKWSGRTIQLGKLFAGKATLAGAVFLNLRFFSTALLAAFYALGAAALLANIYFVFLLKYIVK